MQEFCKTLRSFAVGMFVLCFVKHRIRRSLFVGMFVFCLKLKLFCKAPNLSPEIKESIIVHEPDHFSVPKGGTNSSHVFGKDHTLECFKSLTGPLYNVAYMIQSMETSTQVHNLSK